MTKIASCLVAVILTGCATTTTVVDGVVVPRIKQVWIGQPYLVEHERAHPRPRGPSSGLHDDGGSLGGRVCGMDIIYSVEHAGDHVQLIGFVDQSYPSQLQVHDTAGERHISGNVSGHSVELTLKSDEISGHVGVRVIHVVQEGDRLVGHMRSSAAVKSRDLRVRPGSGGEVMVGSDAPFPVVLTGRDALWSMPAAAQAAILPNLLMCQMSIGSWGPTQPWTGGFGGEATDSPIKSSTLYSAGRLQLNRPLKSQI